jgi:RAT1-interacting protein
MTIPAQVREHGGPNVWDGNVCINFAARFLEALRAGMEEGVLMGIRFEKGGKVVEVFPKEGGTFLTEEFIKWKEQVRNLEG